MAARGLRGSGEDLLDPLAADEDAAAEADVGDDGLALALVVEPFAERAFGDAEEAGDLGDGEERGIREPLGRRWSCGVLPFLLAKHLHRNGEHISESLSQCVGHPASSAHNHREQRRAYAGSPGYP